jgi:hypothetical protein
VARNVLFLAGKRKKSAAKSCTHDARQNINQEGFYVIGSFLLRNDSRGAARLFSSTYSGAEQVTHSGRGAARE